jgi:hypothetical protein
MARCDLPLPTHASDGVGFTAAQVSVARRPACARWRFRLITSNRLLDNARAAALQSTQARSPGMHRDESKQREAARLSGTGVRP